MRTALTDLIAGVPVTDLDAAVAWYTRLLGFEPTLRVGEEVLWDVVGGATLFVEPDPAHAGAGRITFATSDMDAVLAHLASAGIDHEPPETYDSGIRHVSVPDPDGNRIAFAG